MYPYFLEINVVKGDEDVGWSKPSVRNRHVRLVKSDSSFGVREGWIRGAQEIRRAVKILCVLLKCGDTCHSTFVKAHKMYNTEWTLCKRRTLVGNEVSLLAQQLQHMCLLLQDVDGGRLGGAEGVCENAVVFPEFCSEPKTSLKYKVYQFF